MQTPVVTAPNGKEIGYTKVPDTRDVPDEPCWLCGLPTCGRGEYIATGIRPGFADRGLARSMTSASICEHCAWCFVQNLPMRIYSILATTDGIKLMRRNDWRDVVLNPPKPPWVGLAAESGQKFLFYRCDPNYSNRQPHIQWEEETVTIEIGTPALLEVIERLLDKGFSKTEVRTGNYYPSRLDEAGWQEVMGLDEVLRKLSKQRTARLFYFLVWIARLPEQPPKQKKPQRAVKQKIKKKEADTCCTDSKQTTNPGLRQPDLFTLST